MPRDVLEPVYRLIATNRFLEAIQAINKVLKKQPNYLVAKIWKCEALYGLGNVTESEELMAGIIEQTTHDKRTLESIADFYRARGNYTKLVEVYETALKTDPNDESWRKALFECCGLSGDYKKQQQQALLLYKQSPRMLFYCMAVVCLLQQADENPVALELAERMMTKQVDAGQIKSKNEILLLIYVFERRHKFQEALELLNDSSTDLDSLISTKEKRIELLFNLQRWPEIIIHLKQLLQDVPDGWNYYKQYLQSVFQLEALGGTADDPNIEDSMDRAKKFLDKKCLDHPSLRGPFLAGLELLKIKSSCNDINIHKELLLQIVTYFKRFGGKGISVYDLRPYIELLPESYHVDMIRELSGNNFETIDSSELQKLMGISEHISFLQISMLTGCYRTLPLPKKIEKCKELRTCYKNTTSSDDRRDQYLVLEAALRKSMYDETGDALYIIDMVCQLEEVINQGPCVFSVNVLLLQFYFALGAAKAARKIYEQLRIQSVQVDTLSHLFIMGLAATGNFSLASEMWDHALRILQQCTGESLEALIWCYRAGLFHRVEEFARCARRFQKTLTVPFVRGERAYLDVVMAEPGRAEQFMTQSRSKTEWQSFGDNRDLSALPTWGCLGSEEPAADSFAELVLFSRLREETLCCVSAAIVYAKNRNEADYKVFQERRDDLQKIYNDAFTRRDSNSISTSRLSIISHKPLPALIEKLLDYEASSSEKVCALLKQTSEDLSVEIESKISKDPGKKLAAIVSQLEMLSLVSAVCGATRTGLQPNQRRRNDHMVRSIVKCLTQLESYLVVQVPENPDDASYTNRELVNNKLKENYQAAADDMRKVIRRKVAYFNKLLNH